MPHFYLTVIRGENKGCRFKLSEGANSLGRSDGNTITFSSTEKSISSHHAILYVSTDRILIQDLQSTNGVFVNDDKTTEKELTNGDSIGLGKMGPRLKLEISETELPLTPGPPAPSRDTHVTQRGKTVDDGERVDDKNYRPDQSYSHNPGQSISHTMELEKRIMGKDVSASDMHNLLADKKKVGRMLDRGNLGETQAHLLKAVHGANRHRERQWRGLLIAVVVLACVFITFFAVRAFQYKKMVEQGTVLKKKLDAFEHDVAQLNSKPGKNRKKISMLIEKIESTEREFSSVRSQVNYRDRQKFYSDSVELLIDGIMLRFGETGYHIPPKMTERVKYHLSVFSGRMKPSVLKYLQRKKKYEPMIREVLRENNLPEELLYVAMLESGYNPEAKSHAGACGLWQFMRATAKGYGLRVDKTVDERYDPEKATYAAAEYFKDLIAIFGSERSVMLAMAAYNAGENRIIRALRKIDDPMKNRDFWYIYRMGILAEETNEYIPKIISLMIISENQRLYGFE